MKLMGAIGVFILMGLFHQPAWSQNINAGEVKVSADRSSENNNPNEKIGSYKQPRWTAMRAFTSTRTYVIPKNTMRAEYWIRTKTNRRTNANYYLTQREFEVGLGGGVQLDFYHNEVHDFDTKLDTEGLQFELRYAPWNWGEMLMNPTLYLEYHHRVGSSDKAEVRILLGDDFWQNWRWGVNLKAETELWGSDMEQEQGVTVAVGRAVSDPVMIGLEGKMTFTTTQTDRSKVTDEYSLGPMIRWQPANRMNILLTSLIGTNANSYKTENLAIFSLAL